MSSNFVENLIFKSLSIIILITVILIITYAYSETYHIVYNTKGLDTDRDLYKVQVQTLYFIISLISCIVFIDFTRRKKKLKQ